MLTFPSAPPPPRAAPVARPRRAPKVNRLLRTLKLNSLTFLKSPKSPAHAPGAWRHSHPPVSGIFILTSLNDTFSPCAYEHLRSCLHLTNPCAKRKVLSLIKPKGKITKNPRLLYYMKNWLIFTKLFAFNSNTWKHLSMCQQMINGKKINCIR